MAVCDVGELQHRRVESRWGPSRYDDTFRPARDREAIEAHRNDELSAVGTPDIRAETAVTREVVRAISDMLCIILADLVSKRLASMPAAKEDHDEDDDDDTGRGILIVPRHPTVLFSSEIELRPGAWASPKRRIRLDQPDADTDD